MPKTLISAPSSLLALKPLMGKQSETLTLESEHKALLLRSIAQYLDRSGFSKCSKKLLSDAEIEKKELDSDLFNLEEAYVEFLKKKNQEAVEMKDKSGDASDDHESEKKKEAEGDAVEGVEKVKKEAKLELAEEEKVKEADAEIENEQKDKKKKKKSKSVEAEEKEEKVSKKRKRSEPEEKTEETEVDDEESKRRKKEENVQIQETHVNQAEVAENGNVEKSETKSTNQKSKEPKVPFQRVKVDEVVFTDDRLKDNSYWGKGGADIGYGAKAQEVLGQVRGRGFRHEKTKKKRGSYRGGEIDLQSHSVKFEYSDDE